MSDLQDYIEKIVFDGYKQSLNDEENLARSLPFFAAALALVAGVGGAIREGIPPLDLTIYSCVIWILIVLIGGAVFYSLVYLFQAGRKSEFLYPMTEEQLLGYADELREYYANVTPYDRNRNLTVYKEVRKDVLLQTSKAATNNRRVNNERSIARSNALRGLLAALVFAFILVAVMIVDNKVMVHEQPSLKLATPIPAAPTAASETFTSPDAIGREGSGGANQRTQEMKPKDTQQPQGNPSKPAHVAPLAPKTKPTVPDMQTTQKSAVPEK